MDVHIFTGHRGSGKTEVAVNFAIQLARQNPDAPVVLLDVDTVNPYFAGRDARAALESHGVALKAPSLSHTTAGLPGLSGDISRALRRRDARTVVIDAGGDDAGARILRTLHADLTGHALSTYCVVNAKRPATSTVPGILEMLGALEEAARLPITGLMHNTHLLHDTTIDDILRGQQLLEQAALRANIPIVLTTVMKRFVPALHALANDVFAMEQYLQPPYASAGP